MKATWRGEVLAESTETEVVEGNHYFPPSSVNTALFSESANTTRCPWKGVASYYNVNVGGDTNPDAAWYYPEPSAAASNIKGYVAFWNGVEVSDS